MRLTHSLDSSLRFIYLLWGQHPASLSFWRVRQPISEWNHQNRPYQGTSIYANYSGFSLTFSFFLLFFSRLSTANKAQEEQARRESSVLHSVWCLHACCLIGKILIDKTTAKKSENIVVIYLTILCIFSFLFFIELFLAVEQLAKSEII